MTDPQDKYYNNQDTFNLDFDKLYTSFISSVDSLRSHFNALEPNSQQLNTPEYQESRLHAFYRMIGFPVVADANSFYSPGFDPNLNTDSSSLSAYARIADKVINDISLKKQFKSREEAPLTFRKIFSDNGLDAQAITLGSLFIRDIGKQLGSTDPLVRDVNDNQNINERITEIKDIYGSDALSKLTSIHIIKPFIVDPRIDSSVRPVRNRICAPFLKDKSQTKIFQSSSGSSESLKRPFIERVISIRFNNKNITKTSDFINNIKSDIQSNDKITDQDLLNAVSDTLGNLYDSELVIFDNYVKIMKIVTEKLSSSIKGIQYIRQNINFNPIPDSKIGIEGGGKLAPLDPNDNKNNRELEKNIISQTQKKYLSDISFEAGLQGTSDPGDFVFSNLDDSVFSINKNIQKSYDDNIKRATNLRNQSGVEGIDLLRNIEIIMGEFSGIGLIDMVAMQAALWIMPENSLLGLIDKRAFSRISEFRSDTINLQSASQNDLNTSLQDFEKTLKTIYLFIQDYYNSLGTGEAFTAD